MRNLPASIQNHLAQRTGVMVRNFVWFKARNRDTGARETLGVWNGDDTQNFVVGTETRTYVGAGGLIGVGPIRQVTGLTIRQVALSVSHVSPEMAQLIRGYDSKLAPVEVHQGFFNPETNELIAPLQRVFKGWINTMPLKTGAKGQPGSLTINMVGHTRLLTKVTPLRRSHDTQIGRNPIDNFFRFVSITGTMQTAWGSKTIGGSSSGGGFSPGNNIVTNLINIAAQK